MSITCVPLQVLPGQPATDFHYEHIPDNLTCCGPLTIPYPQLQEQDPQLDSWLLQRRTVLVNLGSHIKLSVQNAIHLAKALQVTLERHSDAQVLWKLNCTAEGLSEARVYFTERNKPRQSAHKRGG
ncbi:uncharacterized protein GLRG_11643 [Colletotrichum graminicola M1.001]|uniref:Uncharacterized protein n=1 Tax=Colletotrichum graminicola (strain M1.001 / M2 / FGSC 10212) TaxID=645133 RepID=E3R060_COLGM|nr:uncharacterized protein GLRG_11643 [Colletotrichum graminicola M1.001]EFQ36498.1 hypothetical protein GLRG_11643 [Colletotrichum graminicola M1.001]